MRPNVKRMLFTPTPWPVVISDAFTDANSTALESHTASPLNVPGTPWEVLAGSIDIQSNQANCTVAATSRYVKETNYPDVDITVSVTTRAAADADSIGVVLRAVDANNLWLVIINEASDNLRILERNAGVNTTRATTSLSVAGSTTYRLRVLADGNSISAWVNEGSPATYTSSFNRWATRHGIILGNVGHKADDFLLRRKGDYGSFFGSIVDRFVVAGQSNASGRGVNSQFPSHASLVSGLLKNNNVWGALLDPIDSASGQVDAVSSDGTSAAGSPWPLLATSFMSAQGKPVAFIPACKGGTSITAHLPGADHTDRTTLYGSLVYRARLAGGVKAVLWMQGETDAAAGMSQATYNGHLDTLANAIQADLGVKLVAAKLLHLNTATYSQANQDAINAAIAEAWGDNANVLQGPDLTSIDLSNVGNSSDGLHATTDAALALVAAAWWTRLQALFY